MTGIMCKGEEIHLDTKLFTTGDSIMKMQISKLLSISTLVFAGTLLPNSQASATGAEIINFKLQRPAVVGPKCAPYARGKVKVTTLGDVEVMDVDIEGLPKNTNFDAFVIQVPDFPFGMSWYQGDMQTNSYGKGSTRFIGRFNKETFVVAPNTAPAPHVHATDAASNPPTGPIHTYHIGIWFNSPADAEKAGCGKLKTPFNGEHNAGIQILNTSQFPDEKGPLYWLAP